MFLAVRIIIPLKLLANFHKNYPHCKSITWFNNSDLIIIITSCKKINEVQKMCGKERSKQVNPKKQY